MKIRFFKAVFINPLKASILHSIQGKESRENPTILPLGNKVILCHHISVALGSAFPFYDAGNIQDPKKRKRWRDRISPMKGFSRFGSQPISIWRFRASLIP